nr:hypothetical protein [Enterococcus innesii]
MGLATADFKSKDIVYSIPTPYLSNIGAKSHLESFTNSLEAVFSNLEIGSKFSFGYILVNVPSAIFHAR